MSRAVCSPPMLAALAVMTMPGSKGRAVVPRCTGVALVSRGLARLGKYGVYRITAKGAGVDKWAKDGATNPSRSPAVGFTPAERATLDPLCVAVIAAAAQQAEASAAYETQKSECLMNDDARCRCAPFRDTLDAAIAGTNDAGKALADALGRVRGGK